MGDFVAVFIANKSDHKKKTDVADTEANELPVLKHLNALCRVLAYSALLRGTSKFTNVRTAFDVGNNT